MQKIHPATVSEFDDGNGPAAWVLLIPTTTELMHQFLEKKISEKELYALTPLNSTYEALYLCSGMVLEEYRRKGIAKKLTLDAIDPARKDKRLLAKKSAKSSAHAPTAKEVPAPIPTIEFKQEIVSEVGEIQLERDHIVEYSLGGSNDHENLRLYCSKHNRYRWQTRKSKNRSWVVREPIRPYA